MSDTPAVPLSEMSDEQLSIDEVIERLEKAHKELSAMCERQWNGKAAINWCIPPKKSDSDMIIGDGIRSAIKLIKGFASTLEKK